MTLADQMHTLVSFPDNFVTNPGWSKWSGYTETTDPGLFSVSLLMDPNIIPFVINLLLPDFPIIQNAQRGTSFSKYRYLDGRNPSFASQKMDLIWRWDNLSCHNLNSCCKLAINYGSMMLSICSRVRFFDLFILSSDEIGIYPISGTLIEFRNSLVTIIVFTLDKLVLYFMERL